MSTLANVNASYEAFLSDPAGRQSMTEFTAWQAAPENDSLRAAFWTAAQANALYQAYLDTVSDYEATL